MQRNSIVCKIIEEVSEYLMKKEYYDIDIKIRFTEKESTVIFTTDKIEDELLLQMKKRLTVERREEIEEYCWELIGEGNVSKQDLTLIGAITDEAQIYDEGNKTILRLVRYE